ncbi:hypothetical protein CONPUDRAFT_77886 [Coniophora puteana RWD-64-598 SS2]|uniref:Xylanolytic transcriptional activator regulatory domain-containing protein n=1 Tax=Coniophora puteana (strain RWD-64-598) TaxID=741705 RepID=R7SFF0_CONPW|nr:uncharacterized protein CONPUDRAFT_77886 [Coniophora puteana RWD-64-598 SS2]EIW74600.1 hypothetical protein CONPUDRAFT_77886 [Coniophora puteana RWD-64-598 SS2]
MWRTLCHRVISEHTARSFDVILLRWLVLPSNARTIRFFEQDPDPRSSIPSILLEQHVDFDFATRNRVSTLSRCNGIRPICDQCSRLGLADECEYTDPPRLTHTQALEQEIVSLRARIRELESRDDPEAAEGTIPLADPYAASRNPSPSVGFVSVSRDLSPSIGYVDGSRNPSPSIGFNGSSPNSAPKVPELDWSDITLGMAYLQTRSSPAPKIELEHGLLPSESIRQSEFGFFVDICQELDVSTYDPTHPSKAMLSTIVVLWAVHMTYPDEPLTQEPALLRRAKQQLSNLAHRITPDSLLYILQAELCLAYYFIRNARWFEARYHSNAAISLVVDLNLHRGRSMSPYTSTPVLSCPVETYRELSTHLDQQICTRAFLNACLLDSSLSYMLSIPSLLPSGDTSWLISDTPQVDILGNLGFITQSSVVMCQVATIARAYNHLGNLDSQPVSVRYLKTIIKSYLAVAESMKLSLLTLREYITIASLLHIANIQLHLLTHDPASYAEAAASVLAVANIINGIDMVLLQPLNPCLENLWSHTGRVLVNEMFRTEDVFFKRQLEQTVIVFASAVKTAESAYPVKNSP